VVSINACGYGIILGFEHLVPDRRQMSLAYSATTIRGET
jgi:hypothetical protein